MTADSNSSGGSRPRPEANAADYSIRVLVVDDHTLMRQGLRVLLGTFCKFKVVGDVGDGPAAIRAADEFNPNVILMDVNLPEMSGIEATRQIKLAHPSIGVVGLSMLQSVGIRDAMLQAGATSYLTKSAEAKEVCAAVRAAAITA